jgi:cobalt-zinc-cadmium efflux system outer membrane protein
MLVRTIDVQTPIRLQQKESSVMLLRAGLVSVSIVTFLGCSSVPSDDHAVRETAEIPASVPSPSETESAAPCSVAQIASRLPDEPLPDGEHPLSFYVQAALARNPEVQAAERHVDAQAEVVPQVTALPDPMLTDVGWPSSNQAVQTAAGRVTNSLVLAQQFPWFGKLRLRGEVARLATKIALTQLAETQLKVIEEVKLAYYDIYYNNQALKIIDESEKILQKEFFEPAKAGFGKSSRLDVARAQVEFTKLQDRRIQLRQTLKQAQANLAKALSTNPEADLKAPEIPDLPVVAEQLEELYQAALLSRPELQGRIDAVSQSERLVELARLNYFPDVSLGFVWNDLTTDNALSKTANGENSLGIAFGINLPIWESKLRAGVREAQNRTSENLQLYRASRDETFRDIRQLTVQALAQKEQMDLLRNELVPNARQALALAIEGYKAGNVDPVRVVDNWLQWTNVLLELAGVETSIGKTMASLERFVGRQLTPLAGSPGPSGCPAAVSTATGRPGTVAGP